MLNEVANDLASARIARNEEDNVRLREIAALRYAEDLSPEAFSGYISEERGGTYALSRLPAADDPQFSRTQRARQRERNQPEAAGRDELQTLVAARHGAALGR